MTEREAAGDDVRATLLHNRAAAEVLHQRMHARWMREAHAQRTRAEAAERERDNWRDISIMARRERDDEASRLAEAVAVAEEAFREGMLAASQTAFYPYAPEEADYVREWDRSEVRARLAALQERKDGRMSERLTEEVPHFNSTERCPMPDQQKPHDAWPAHPQHRPIHVEAVDPQPHGGWRFVLRLDDGEFREFTWLPTGFHVASPVE